MVEVIYKVKSFEDLKNNLDIFNISPQEAWKLVHNQKKLGLTTKSLWKMKRFQLYIYQRLDEFVEIAKKYQQKENKTREEVVKNPNELKKLSKKLPKRVDSIRKLVKTPLFKNGFKSFNKDKKLDERAEVQKLAKLIVEKRQNYWFHPTFYKTSRGSFKEVGLGHTIKYIR